MRSIFSEPIPGWKRSAGSEWWRSEQSTQPFVRAERTLQRAAGFLDPRQGRFFPTSCFCLCNPRSRRALEVAGRFWGTKFIPRRVFAGLRPLRRRGSECLQSIRFVWSYRPDQQSGWNFDNNNGAAFSGTHDISSGVIASGAVRVISSHARLAGICYQLGHRQRYSYSLCTSVRSLLPAPVEWIEHD